MPRVLRRARAAGAARRGRRPAAARDPRAAQVPVRCRPRLPEPRPPIAHPVRRRGAAHQPDHRAGHLARQHACSCSTSRPSACMPRDVGRIVGVMQRLRDAGNTLVVVEHDEGHAADAAEAQGAHLLPDGHASRRACRSAAAADHRRVGVQRAVPRGGSDPAREHHRRRGQRLGGRDHDADARAFHAWPSGSRRRADRLARADRACPDRARSARTDSRRGSGHPPAPRAADIEAEVSASTHIAGSPPSCATACPVRRARSASGTGRR